MYSFLYYKKPFESGLARMIKAGRVVVVVDRFELSQSWRDRQELFEAAADRQVAEFPEEDTESPLKYKRGLFERFRMGSRRPDTWLNRAQMWLNGEIGHLKRTDTESMRPNTAKNADSQVL